MDTQTGAPRGLSKAKIFWLAIALWMLTVVPLIVGGVYGGYKGYVFGRQAREQRLRSEAFFVASIPDSPRLTRADRLRLGRVHYEMIGVRWDEPNFRADLNRALGRTVADDEVGSAIRSVTHRGLLAISPEKLDQLYALKLRMSEQSPEFCAQQWNGAGPVALLYEQLAKLTDDQLHLWYALEREALDIAMAPGFVPPATPVPADAVAPVTTRLENRLSDADYSRVIQISRAGTNVGNADACWAHLHFFRTARELPPQQRADFYRIFP